MSWLQEILLRDLGPETMIETACRTCGHEKLYKAASLSAQAPHRDVTLDEVASALVCVRPGCRAPGARLSLLHQTSARGFVAGLP